jgi:hypothetical protein
MPITHAYASDHALSNAAEALGLRDPRPIYTSCVIDGRECPSWSAMSRADRPASSKIVAQVLRKTCEVTQVKPAVPLAVRRSRDVLLGSRQPPTESGKSDQEHPAPADAAGACPPRTAVAARSDRRRLIREPIENCLPES